MHLPATKSAFTNNKKWNYHEELWKIRVCRENQDLAQEEMAVKLNMSTIGYAKIERGETRLNIRRLEQIVDIF